MRENNVHLITMQKCLPDQPNFYYQFQFGKLIIIMPLVGPELV